MPLPRSAMPMASVRQFMEFAVYMPEQEPHVGQTFSSYSRSFSSVIVGASVSIFGDVGIVELFTDLVEKFQFTWVLVFGMVVYLIVGIFIRLSTSKLEIRI